MRVNRARDIAIQIEAAIRGNSSAELPSIRQLQVRHGVSYKTAWKAMQLLVSKGLVKSAPGKKMRACLSGTAGPGDDPLASSEDRLCARIKQRILDGVYPAGRRFPKMGYFAVTENVSPTILSLVFRRLEGEKLAHSHRRHWIAGPSPSRGEARRARSVAVFLIFNPGDWRNFFGTDHFASFTSIFRNELENFGVDLRPAIPGELMTSDVDLPAEFVSLSTLIPALGERYCGTFTTCITPDQAYLAQTIGWICRWKRPVVYFDYTNDGPLVTRKRAGSDSKQYYRLHCDESATVTCALKELQKAGHRTIAVHGSQLSDWTRQRTRLLRECAGNIDPSMAIVEAAQCDPDWSLGDAGMEDVIARASRRAQDELPNERRDIHDREVVNIDSSRPVLQRTDFRATILEKGRSLASLLAQSRATALVALNDALARQYAAWFRALGIEVPRQISIVSFDNAPRSFFYPISTVDFGFPRLGYLSAHALIGDIPLTATRDGFIPGIPTLMDRGSIAAPDNSQALYLPTTMHRENVFEPVRNLTK